MLVKAIVGLSSLAASAPATVSAQVSYSTFSRRHLVLMQSSVQGAVRQSPILGLLSRDGELESCIYAKGT